MLRSSRLIGAILQLKITWKGAGGGLGRPRIGTLYVFPETPPPPTGYFPRPGGLGKSAKLSRAIPPNRTAKRSINSSMAGWIQFNMGRTTSIQTRPSTNTGRPLRAARPTVTISDACDEPRPGGDHDIHLGYGENKRIPRTFAIRGAATGGPDGVHTTYDATTGPGSPAKRWPGHDLLFHVQP